MITYSLENIEDFINAPASSDGEESNKDIAVARTDNSINSKKDNESLFSHIIYDDRHQQSEDHSCQRGKILPEVLLFKDGSGVRIIDTSENLGDICKTKETIFRRVAGGNNQEKQIQVLDKERNLQILSPALACSEFEKVASIVTYKKGKIIHAVLSETDAKKILCCESFIERLPPLKIITKCPVISETPDGGIKIITRYDRDTGIYAMGEKPKEMNIGEAVEIILSSIDEFSFKTPADKSRAIASIITPALIMGGVAKFRSPIEYIEADDSQAGKGFKTRITAAYYNETPYPINQRRGGGVGSLEESFNQAVIEARLFINLDNIKPTKDGVFDSEPICSFLTEDMYFARMLRQAMFINPKMHIIQMTTNGCTLSKDLMNRSSPIAILKRKGYEYKEYLEGSILDHIKHNQSLYLGAVFSVIGAWIRKGKPKTATTAHESSFIPWAQSLDWIVQHIMGQAPLLDGYQQVRDRITSPYLQRLRDIALIIIKTKRKEEWLTASDIMETVGPEGCELPGMDSGYDFEKLAETAKEHIKRQLGLSFTRAFKNHGSDDVLILDGIRIERKEVPKTYDYGTTKDIKYYKFSHQ